MNNNPRNKYSFAPTYGAQKKVSPPPKGPVKQPPNRNRQPVPSAPYQGQYPDGGFYPPQNQEAYPPSYPQAAGSQATENYSQFPYQGQIQPPNQVPQQWYDDKTNHPYSVPPFNQAAGTGNYPFPSQQPQQGYYPPSPNYADSSQPYSQAPPSQPFYEQGGYTAYENNNHSSYYPPSSQPFQRKKRASSANHAIDTFLQIALFFIAPLLFLLTLFNPTMAIAKWLFVGVSVSSLGIMWMKGSFISSARIVLTLIYLALTGVVLVTLFVGQAPDTISPPDSNIISTQGTNITDPSSLNQGASSPEEQNPSGIIPSSPEEGPETLPEETSLEKSESIQQLRSFLEYWIQNDKDSMLSLVSPEWKGQQSEPVASFFGIIGGRQAVAYEILSATGSDGEGIRNVFITVTMKQLAGNKTYQYDALLRKENDVWYVDPTVFKTTNPVAPPVSEEEQQAQERQQLQQEESNQDITVYYNPNGGQYYHLVDDCSSVKAKKDLPLQPLSFSSINNSPYDKLKTCTVCNPPARP